MRGPGDLDGPRRRLVIAGVTGSIGEQALQVLDAVGDLELVGISAGAGLDAALRIAERFGVGSVALAGPCDADRVQLPDGVRLEVGPNRPAEMISELEPDIVLNAVVGFAGLAVSIAALESGADLALANKESLVAGGSLLTALADAHGAEIIPVDSEHASIAQLLEGAGADEIESITLTASGGPFRGWSPDRLGGVTVEQALAHPTWEMGGKISIDSATLMNKGLEVIEAHHLFSLDYDSIGVVVHPQSLVHGFVSLVDGMVIAHLGIADMRSPIAWALAGGRRPALPIERLDLAAVGSLEFAQPDSEAFPCLGLAVEAGRQGGTAPTVLNAANEVAVENFLAGRIPFPAIPSIVEATLEGVSTGQVHDFATVNRADSAAREFASEAIQQYLRP